MKELTNTDLNTIILVGPVTDNRINNVGIDRICKNFTFDKISESEFISEFTGSRKNFTTVIKHTNQKIIDALTKNNLDFTLVESL